MLVMPKRISPPEIEMPTLLKIPHATVHQLCQNNFFLWHAVLQQTPSFV